jgi:Flp pilus assembly pilin Flp
MDDNRTDIPRADEAGQAMAEYGLILALIVLMAVGGLIVLGNPVMQGLWGGIVDAWPA